jgi:IS30 family transposase
MVRRTYGQLSLKERIDIYRLHADGKSVRFIANYLARSASTISRELRRNSQGTRVWPRDCYDPERAQELYERRHARGRAHKLERQPELRSLVMDQLAMVRSPEQIAGRLTGKDGKALISHESIYRYIYWHSYHYRTEELHKLLPSRRRRRQRRGMRRKGVSPIPNRTPLCARPAEAINRSRCGHWEADLMQFSQPGKSVLVLYDRHSRYASLRWQETRKAPDVINGLHVLFEALPHNSRKTVTFDNGQEFRLHQELTESKGIRTFFCEPHAPWQKGGVENTIGRLRRFLPRTTDPNTLPAEALEKIMDNINNTPRKCLGFKTPAEVFFNQSVALQT